MQLGQRLIAMTIATFTGVRVNIIPSSSPPGHPIGEIDAPPSRKPLPRRYDVTSNGLPVSRQWPVACGPGKGPGEERGPRSGPNRHASRQWPG
jgi:hypothetical protein